MAPRAVPAFRVRTIQVRREQAACLVYRAHERLVIVLVGRRKFPIEVLELLKAKLDTNPQAKSER